MSGTREGQVDIEELLRRHGEEALVREAENAGLSPRARRVRCPFKGCAHKGQDRERDAQIFAGGHPRIFCFACEEKGDLVDLLQLTRGWNQQEAIAHLSGQPVASRPVPQLRVVQGLEGEDPDKLKPSDVKRLWEAMAKEDPAAQAYLEKRGLGEAAKLGLVRFATDAHPDGRVKGHAKRGYRIAVLLTDVVGNPRGIQMRLAREPRNSDEPKVISVKGSNPSKAFFGPADLIEAEPMIVVAEGIADTLSISSWVHGRKGIAIVGASGKSNLAKLAGELEAANIDLTGKTFVLFPQNDRPKNHSRREFVRLGQLLVKRAARVVTVNTDDEFKDIAQWLGARPDAEWPPAEVRKAHQPEPGDETPADQRSILASGCAVPIPAAIRAKTYAQDFTTLCTLLDDPMHREAIMGPGEITWCEMTWRVRHAGRELSDVDLSTIRLGLEDQGRTSEGKPLKFSEDEIAKALTVVSRKKSVHPVRDWLNGLAWDGKHRLLTELPAALGHEAASFPAVLLTRWMISAVARAMVPGSKVDTVLVLVGNQGDRKSTFFEILGGAWFTDSPVNVGDKDGKLVMRRAWIVEWAELDSMRRARDQESIKAFISARVDLFRKPYGRDVIEAPRHCVIVGTSNPREFLADPTGNRRFWTIEVNKRIDFHWVREHRDQLWAEAIALYRAGEQWWLTDEEDVHLADSNRGHEIHHPWTDVVRDWLSNRLDLEVTGTQILVDAIGMTMDRIGRATETEIGRVMKTLGWERKRRRAGDGLRWVYVRPEHA